MHGSVQGSPGWTDMDELKRVQQRPQRLREWSTSHTSQVRKLHLFRLEKRGFRGDLIYSSRDGAKKETGSLQWSPKDGKQWAQNETQIPFKHMKNFFTLRVMKYWNKLSRGVEGFPVSETLKM